MASQFHPLGIGVGTLIAGRYEITRKLGAGAMSAVFVARDRELGNHQYAIKIFNAQAAENGPELERFKQEVIVTRKLTHPNIVRTFEFGSLPNSQYFIVMEIVEGKTLHELIHAPEGLPFIDLLKYLEQIASAMDYAHKEGVIHRDLKPANILISTDGVAKVADFGLALSSEIKMRLTQTGQTVGTPAYMAPEQLYGRLIDNRTDVYALGVVAYEAATGELPFSATDWYQLASRITNEKVPQIHKSFGVPSWYDQLVQKATSKEPEKRFNTAGEFAEIIKAHLENKNQLTQKRREKNKKDLISEPPPWLLALISKPSAIVVIAVAFIMVIFANYLKPEKQVESVAESVNNGTKLINDFADSVSKLNKVVMETAKNKEQINSLAETVEEKTESK
jgi:eukaryotic-like serine/threonine-protein kinase